MFIHLNNIIILYVLYLFIILQAKPKEETLKRNQSQEMVYIVNKICYPVVEYWITKQSGENLIIKAIQASH